MSEPRPTPVPDEKRRRWARCATTSDRYLLALESVLTLVDADSQAAHCIREAIAASTVGSLIERCEGCGRVIASDERTWVTSDDVELCKECFAEVPVERRLSAVPAKDRP